jgi:hypothetical protein
MRASATIRNKIVSIINHTTESITRYSSNIKKPTATASLVIISMTTRPWSSAGASTTGGDGGMMAEDEVSSPVPTNSSRHNEPTTTMRQVNPAPIDVDSPPMLVSDVSSSSSALPNHHEEETTNDVHGDDVGSDAANCTTQSSRIENTSRTIEDWPRPPTPPSIPLASYALDDSIDDSRFMAAYSVPPMQENASRSRRVEGAEGDSLDACTTGDHGGAHNARSTSNDHGLLLGNHCNMADTAPVTSIDVDDKHSAAPMHENLSQVPRRRTAGTDDAAHSDTWTIRDQQQRVDALRFAYQNLATSRGLETTAGDHNDQHNTTNSSTSSSKLKRDHESSNNNPVMMGPIPKYTRVEEHVPPGQQDWKLACQLQQDLFESSSVLDVESSMKSTIAGRAFQFVERVIQVHQNQLVAASSSAVASANPQYQHEQIELVAMDDMYFMAERMMQQQAEFSLLGKPIHVDIGFHYTDAENMDNIRTNGLLSRAEQEESCITARTWCGIALGDGIYTGNNPQVFSHYGTVGILVARLKGRTRHSQLWSECDTVETRQMVVLKSSSQCIPLVHFPKSIVEPLLFTIARFHDALQNATDEFFNNNGGRVL